MQEEAIKACLASDKVDLSELRLLSRKNGGFQSSRLRKRVWPKLLGLSANDYKLREGRVELVDTSFDYRRLIDVDHRDKEQVAVDIERSLFNISQLQGWTEKQIQDEREIISNHILAVISQHRELHYFQGFHDVVSILCLVLGSQASEGEDEEEVLSQQLIFRVVERVSTSYFQDCARADFGTITKVMPLVLDIIRDRDEGLYAFLRKAGVPPFFATSWIICWWSHDLKDLTQASRIFDVLISSPPYYCLYLCSAYLLVMSAQIQKEECDFAFLHSALSKGVARWGFPAEKVIAVADELLFGSEDRQKEQVAGSDAAAGGGTITRESFATLSKSTLYQRVLGLSHVGGLMRLQWKGHLSMFEPQALHSPSSTFNLKAAPSDTALFRDIVAGSSPTGEGGDTADQPNPYRYPHRNVYPRYIHWGLQVGRLLRVSLVACVEMLEFLFFLDVPDISSPGTGGDEDGDEDEEEDEDGGSAMSFESRYFYRSPPRPRRAGLRLALAPLRRAAHKVSRAVRDRQTLLLVAVGFVGGLTAVGFRVLQERGGW